MYCSRLILIAAVLLLLASRADALTVALLEPSTASPALREATFRVQGELLAVGLDVAIVQRPRDRTLGDDELRSWLAQLAAERGVDAILDVVGQRTPQGVDVWVFRPANAAEVQRVVVEPDAPNPAGTLAIRAIEVLRSRFVEFDLAMREQRHERTVEPERKEPVPPPSPPLGPGLAAGAVLLGSIDRVGPALLPLARLEWATPSPVVAHATLAGLGTNPTIETLNGNVRLAQEFGVLGASCCRSAGSGLQPYLALAAGVLRTSLDGESIAPSEGHHVLRWSFLLEGSVGLRLPLPDPYHLTIASHVQLAEPTVAIHAVDAVVATTGRPNLLVSVILGAWL